MSLTLARFIAIGLLGLILQLSALWLLTSLAHWSWLPATLVAVELAVMHNFLWHARWTWRDRLAGTVSRFVRFQFANGVASIAGNAALTALFVGVLRLPPLPANALAVAMMSAVNFLAADRWVFRRRDGVRLAAGFWIVCMAMPSGATAQPPEALAAWQRYVAATEARLEQSRTQPARRPPVDITAPAGDSVRVPSGTISDWRGSVFIPGVTLDEVLHRLQNPGTPPPQEDVVSSRVLARSDNCLRVAIGLVRHAIVTVSYDTEHEMRFHRWTPGRATARSVATRIEEAGGTDHGLLWRLHSYWRYDAVDGGVLVELQSLTLSRDVPSLIRPIAAPLVTRIARESVLRTLDALRRFFKV